MPFGRYDPDVEKALQSIFDGMWMERRVAGTSASSLGGVADAIRLTRALLDAAETGERDTARLRAIALETFHS